ncbi:H-NS histone family protein [Cupriavidus plantarum]|uniref:H-NS histone family protein n=1 Tax=Cupriavidus plantarum TaxID=942865 RepID=UPI00339D3770
MPTYKELLAQRTELEQQIAAAREQEVGTAIARIQELMTQYGLSPEDIIVKRRGRKPGSKSAKKAAPVALYRDPKTGKTWSGRGREPGWIAGKKRDRFLIEA